MAKSKTPTKPTTPAPPKAASAVQAPLDVASEAPLRGELDLDVVPAEDAVRDVAVQLAMQDGERRPFNIVHGRPVWAGYAELARAGLTAIFYMEKRRG